MFLSGIVNVLSGASCFGKRQKQQDPNMAINPKVPSKKPPSTGWYDSRARHVWKQNNVNLVGGWTNPFEKYDRQIGSFPQGSGWKYKMFEITTENGNTLVIHSSWLNDTKQKEINPFNNVAVAVSEDKPTNSWWFQPTWKIRKSRWESSPNRGNN